MFADEIRRAIEAASRITLPQVTALLWRAYGDGRITEAEAEALSGLIEARSLASSGPRREQGPASAQAAEPGIPALSSGRPGSLRTAAGSRPRKDASMERRRRWAASGRLPPQIAARFTQAEVAVLATLAAETARRGDCRLAVEHLAALAGVSRSTVKATLRRARRLGLLTVEERRMTAWRNDTNIVRVVSREWLAWMRLARRESRLGGGVKSPTATSTKVLESHGSRTAEPSQGASGRGAAGAAEPLRGRMRFAEASRTGTAGHAPHARARST